MFGVLIYTYFLIIGFLYANRIFADKGTYYKCYMGAVFGNVLLMAGIIPFALIFGFSYTAHIILIVASAIPYIILKLKKKTKKLEFKSDVCIDWRILTFLVLPVSLVIWILMTNHILTPMGDGSVASGQCTYGDLQMHLGFVTSIAEQGKFPPNYAFLAGERLNYPFLPDMLSSSLYLFGASLRWAVLIPSFVISALLVMGFYMLAYKMTGKKAAAVLAVLFFFINGGFGFAYFLDGARADHTAFTKIFTDYYHTPTNYNEMNIRWSNTICDMIIPQRTTMFGWCMIIPCLMLLIDAIKTSSRKLFVILGIIAGCMPMIHTHSFLALGIISAVMFFAYLIGEDNKKDYTVNWVIYGAIAVGMALPQLIFWTFSQTSGNDSFLNFRFNWVNVNDPYLWFYIKNWGMAFLLAIPAFFNTNTDNKKMFVSAAVIFLIAELIQFQPNEYDNNKLFYITYMIVIIITSELVCCLYDKLSGIKLRQYFAVAVIFAYTFSGILTIGREYVSGGKYQTFSGADIKTAEYIKENLPKDAVFLTSTSHINPVVTLAGRSVYVGSSLYVYFHGFTEEYQKRSNEIKTAYSGTANELIDFCESNNIQYVYVSNNERNEFQINDSELECLNKIYEEGSNAIYAIKNPQ